MDWVNIINNLGFPTVICIVVLSMVYKSGKWLTKNAIQPIISAHLAFLESVKIHMDKMDDISSQQTDILGKLEKGMDELLHR